MNKLIGEPLNGRTGHEAGRELLARLYRSQFGGEIPEILIESGGKPYFAHGNIHFSITHTREHAFCVLADSPVGIDAEELTRKVSPNLAEKILSPSEDAQYQAVPEEEQNEALLRFWVLKEAEAKCSGLGLRGYPNHTEFDLDDPRVQKIGTCMVAVICAEEPQVEDHTAPQEEADAL